MTQLNDPTHARSTADALAALLQGDGQTHSSPRAAAPLVPQEALITAVVRAALFAVRAYQQTAGADASKRRLLAFNVPHVFPAGEVQYTGTRAWFDRTFIRAQNTGEIAATIEIGDRHLHLEPGQAHTVEGAWAAFLVRIRNMSDDPRAQFTVTIT